uniref:Uncharacterized protein n=1 Tax=Anguilla anguilla TaxID=7936 RepID=A0A0E9SFM2_ANGAN
MNNFPNKQNVILMVKNCILFSLMLHFSKLRTARTAPCYFSENKFVNGALLCTIHYKCTDP